MTEAGGGAIRPRDLRALRPASRFVQAGIGYDAQYGAIPVPVYRAATFQHPAFGVSTGFDYSRLANPTRAALERVVAELTGGCRAFAFPSGMAALACAFSVLSAGDHLLCAEDIYGHTYRLLVDYLVPAGVEVSFVDTSRPEEMQAGWRPNTRALFFETPSNPMMRVTDIAEAVRQARQHEALVIVDNTFLTPYGQRPLELGADIEVHSATKFLAGHNDTLAGLLAVADAKLADRLAHWQIIQGAVLSPDDAWLVLRGLKTLPLRFERQSDNAAVLARWLREQPSVTRVCYPGLAEHPGHEVQAAQAQSFGAMLSFEVRHVWQVDRVLSGLQVILFAESLGGVETLITYPAGQTHRDVPAEVRRRLGISDRLLRLSVGIEDVRDLQDDLARALDAAG